MEFFTKAKGYSEREEEEEEEEEEEIRRVACDFLGNSQQYQKQEEREQECVEEGSNGLQNQQPLMDLSLRMESSSSSNNNNNGFGVEREHMFDKVVTPSDVGKLNRLVIPKQHAEKYFPLDSATNEKGLILNFEDRNGKPWRFRYSYWNSSQSYVMTKGWSRFVKDKKLDAGDVVSFQRGLADSAKDRLFIDWRRRPDAPSPHQHFSNPLLLLPQSLRWASTRHFTPPTTPHPHPPPPPPQHPRRTHQPLHNYSNLFPNYAFEIPNFGMPTHGRNNNSSMFYFRPSISSSSSSSLYRIGNNGDEIVVNNESSSMGINKAGSSSATAAKRLRLFGVNMECAAADGELGEEDLSNGGVSRRGKEPLSLNWDLL